jgi:hypothetical protein
MPLWVGSSYSPLSGLNFRFCPQSSYSPSENFSAVNGSKRPEAAVREIRNNPPQAGLFDELH